MANGQARVPYEVNPNDPTGWYAQKRSTLGAALVFTAPGIPMIFQGQEFLQGEWFRDDVPLDWDLDHDFGGIVWLYRDLIRLRRNVDGQSRGLTGQHLTVLHANDPDNVVALHRWADGGPGDDVVVVVNLSHRSRTDYVVGMPAAGRWKLLLNSDATDYSPDFAGTHSEDIDADADGYDGQPARGTVSIGPYTVLIYSRADRGGRPRGPGQALERLLHQPHARVTRTAPTKEPMIPLGRKASPSPDRRLISSPPTNEPTRPLPKAIGQLMSDQAVPSRSCASAPTIMPNRMMARRSMRRTIVPRALSPSHRTASPPPGRPGSAARRRRGRARAGPRRRATKKHQRRTPRSPATKLSSSVNAGSRVPPKTSVHTSRTAGAPSTRTPSGAGPVDSKRQSSAISAMMASTSPRPNAAEKSARQAWLGPQCEVAAEPSQQP